MRQTILIFPGLLRSADDSILLAEPRWREISEHARTMLLPEIPTKLTPEACWLGLAPNEAQMPQGPLTVAWLSADPPPRSTHFHVSILSLQDDVLGKATDCSAEEAVWIASALKKLETKSLIPLIGDRLDHGLVWEQWGDMGVASPEAAIGSEFHKQLPEGDGDVALRRFIDDSVNLLHEAEFNLRRIDEGRPPLNIAWPWGAGRRADVPNLAIRYGMPIEVWTRSIRVAGLAWLARLRVVSGDAFGRAMMPNLAGFRSSPSNVKLMIVPGFESQAKVAAEEQHWLFHKLLSDLVEPEALLAKSGESMLTLVALREAESIAMQWPRPFDAGNWPSDERLLDEPKAPKQDFWNFMQQALTLADVQNGST